MLPEEKSPTQDEDDQFMLDHCALECMRAIEMKDKEAFRQSFHVLVADILHQLSSDMEEE